MSHISIEGRSQIAIGAGGQTAPLEAGLYDVWAETETFIKVHPSDATDVSDATGYVVPVGVIVRVRIGRDGLRIGSTAAASVHRVA